MGGLSVFSRPDEAPVRALRDVKAFHRGAGVVTIKVSHRVSDGNAVVPPCLSTVSGNALTVINRKIRLPPARF